MTGRLDLVRVKREGDRLFHLAEQPYQETMCGMPGLWDNPAWYVHSRWDGEESGLCRSCLAAAKI